jgi:hypothetical protein
MVIVRILGLCKKNLKYIEFVPYSSRKFFTHTIKKIKYNNKVIDLWNYKSMK